MEPITCQFVFTSREHMRSVKCHWLHPPASFWLGGIVLLFLGTVIYLSFLSDPQHPPGFNGIILNLFPFAVFVGVFLFMKWLSFRSAPLFNKELLFSFNNEGVSLKYGPSETEAKWESFSRVIEDKNGFAIYTGPKRFYWLPKSGFTSRECVVQCRELMRRKVKNANILDQGQAGG